MRLVFVKRRLAYPRSSGHDVHTWQLMRALADIGHEVAYGSLEPIDPNAVRGLTLIEARDLSRPSGRPGGATIRLTPLQERFRQYWGIDPRAIAEVGTLAEAVRADAVVVSGLEILPCLGAVGGAVRVWYAGDEWVRHHLSLVRLLSPESWPHLKLATLKGAYEWAYARAVDRVWVVSEDERRAVRRVMWTPGVDVVPNGVDIDHFAATGVAERPKSACFWGRLDFDPNIDALTWFCRDVWPLVMAREPEACLTVYGFQPGPPVERLVAGTPGVRLVPNLPDLRREIEAHALVVLPFVSGGGIKNKLLEAAALARPVIASPRACEGLHADAPVIVATRPQEWVAAILELWRTPERRLRLGAEMRAWVAANHTWTAAAREAARGIEATRETLTP